VSAATLSCIVANEYTWRAVAWPIMWKQWRHPQNRKYISYRNATGGGPSIGHGCDAQNLVMIGCLVCKICKQTVRRTDRQTDRQRDTIFCSLIRMKLIIWLLESFYCRSHCERQASDVTKSGRGSGARKPISLKWMLVVPSSLIEVDACLH